MKKIILAVAAMFVATGAFAQMEWGVKAGLNLANITNGDMYTLDGAKVEAKMKPSIYLGAFVEFRINDYLGIQPEVLYSRQGAFYKEGDGKSWLRMNYINIPILAKIYVLEKLSLDLGPQFGILLNAKEKYKYDGGDSGTNDIDDMKNFDVSVPIGLSYKFGSFDVSARYVLGLTEIVDSHGGDKSKNSVIQIGAGYRF